MKRHTKIYLDSCHLTTADVILCEIRAEGCENVAVDICHIDHRGMGGNKKKDKPENLIAGCRHCHILVDSEKIDREPLKILARERTERNAIACD